MMIILLKPPYVNELSYNQTKKSGNSTKFALKKEMKIYTIHNIEI